MNPTRIGHINLPLLRPENPPPNSKTFAPYESKTGLSIEIEGIDETNVSVNRIETSLVVDDSITEAMANDPDIFHVIDTWGFDAAGMKAYVLLLGIERVRDEVRRVRKMHWLTSRGAYLNKCLNSKLPPDKMLGVGAEPPATITVG